jgi:hypothetical protein
MKKHSFDMYGILHMIHVKDNIFLVHKEFLFKRDNLHVLTENHIKKIIVCTEYIDKDILRDETLSKFILDSDIELTLVFDTDLLIDKTKNIIKGTSTFKEIRDDLRIKQLRRSDVFKKCSDDGRNTLLVCNKMNKMSPVFYLLIEKERIGGIDLKFIDMIDDFPSLKSNLTRKQKVLNIIECYNMLK